MNETTDAIIIGGGLAGLTAALHLLKEGFQVRLIERDSYPHHKVCGEYVSAEVVPYLQWLEADVLSLSPVSIRRLLFTTVKGRETHAQLPLGGLGISRYALDHFLFTKVKEKGGMVYTDTVTDISFDGAGFKVATQSSGILEARVAIGAYGKRSSLDQKLERQFIRHKSPWLAVKAHYKGSFPEDLVALHNFKGGYCGVSKVEDSKLNICYLVDYAAFKKHKNISAFQEQVMYQNPHLKDIFERSSILFDAPLTISQISFEQKELIKDHVLMIGDSAGLIHPLCGNGMAMAIHGAKICSELVIPYLNGEIDGRMELENQYKQRWNAAFKSRLSMGRLLSGLLRNETLTNLALSGMNKMPFLLPEMIKKTHGKPLITNT
jgi:flavin-dependent dehydrogenase